MDCEMAALEVKANGTPALKKAAIKIKSRAKKY